MKFLSIYMLGVYKHNKHRDKTTVKLVCNDHLEIKVITCDFFNYVFQWWLKVPTYSAPAGREVPHQVVVVDRFHCIWNYKCDSMCVLIYHRAASGLCSMCHCSLPWHTEVETNWLPFRRRHFQMHFWNANVWIIPTISLKYVPKVRNKNIPSLVRKMATDNYLNQWWLVYRSIYAPVGLSELTLAHKNTRDWINRSAIFKQITNTSVRDIQFIKERTEYMSNTNFK